MSAFNIISKETEMNRINKVLALNLSIILGLTITAILNAGNTPPPLVPPPPTLLGDECRSTGPCGVRSNPCTGATVDAYGFPLQVSKCSGLASNSSCMGWPNLFYDCELIPPTSDCGQYLEGECSTNHTVAWQPSTRNCPRTDCNYAF